MLRQRPVWPLLHRAICWRADATSIGLSFEAQYKLRNPEFTTLSRVLITIQSPSIYASSPPNFDPSSIRWGHSFGQAEIRLLIRKTKHNPLTHTSGVKLLTSDNRLSLR